MTQTEHDLRVSARTYRLTAGANEDSDDDGPPYRFGGVAVAAGDILHMDDGTRVLMTADELRAAAESQAGEPLTKDHPEDDSGRPKYPPDVDETFGKVEKAGWVESQQAVAYESTTHDETIADGVMGESYEVSVHPFFRLEYYDGPEADAKAVDINFGDLSVVAKGDSPSNTAQWGPNEALASWTASADFDHELTAAADVEDDPEGLVERLARMMGIIPDRPDRRGYVYMVDQTSDGTSIRLDEASFGDATWMPCAHLEGDEYPDVGPGLGPSIGDGEAFDAGEIGAGVSIDLDEDLEEDSTVYVALHYASEDGEKLDHITTADGGYFYDSAFAGVAPDEAEVTADSSDGGDESTETTAAESAVDQENSDMGSNPDGTTDGQDDDPDGGDGSTEPTLGEMTPSEAASALGDELKDQGFVTEDNADEIVAQAQDEITQSEQVDEIIAKSDDYDEDDREELLASSPKVIDNVHGRVREQSAVGMPGNAGAMGSLTAGASGRSRDNEGGDDYGTGVAGDGGE